MFGLRALLPLALLIATSSAIPVLEERAAATCGSVYVSTFRIN